MMIRCAACKKKFTDNVAFEQHDCVKEAEKLSTEELLRQYHEGQREQDDKGRSNLASLLIGWHQDELPDPNYEADKRELEQGGAFEAIVEPLLRADRKDWDRLEAYLAKDMSGHGQFWQQIMKEVRQAIETKARP